LTDQARKVSWKVTVIPGLGGKLGYKQKKRNSIPGRGETHSRKVSK
jgi:hypothetical protein